MAMIIVVSKLGHRLEDPVSWTQLGTRCTPVCWPSVSSAQIHTTFLSLASGCYGLCSSIWAGNLEIGKVCYCNSAVSQKGKTTHISISDRSTTTTSKWLTWRCSMWTTFWPPSCTLVVSITTFSITTWAVSSLPIWYLCEFQNPRKVQIIRKFVLVNSLNQIRI